MILGWLLPVPLVQLSDVSLNEQYIGGVDQFYQSLALPSPCWRVSGVFPYPLHLKMETELIPEMWFILKLRRWAGSK
jgi:hypothetical protein